ncbi:MAG: hypothetical protein RLN88_09515 [Ekhidna sp.]|uniref:hypothetical protein n=1 Tax=Ekhidna sp. TaxID=2608089 RepID=UPI0032EC17E8
MKIKKILLDIVPVLVGILLALFINNWQQSCSESAYIRNSVSSIIKENEANIRELEYSLQRQAKFMDTLSAYLDDESYTLADVIKKTQGVTTPDLKSTTWKFLVQDSKHTLVSYEFINWLAEIEKYEVLVNRYNSKVGDIIFQPAFFDDPRLKQVCLILFSDFGATEMSLIKELREFNEFARETYNIELSEQ